MVGARKVLKSTPISAISVWATLSLTPGIPFSRSMASRKGASAVSSLTSNSAIVASILLDRLQVLADEKAMMVARPALQRGDKLLMGAGQPGMTQPSQYTWITFARHDRSQNPPTPEAENIRDDGGQLDVGFLQCRLNTLGAP